MALDPTRLSSPEDCLAVYERGFAGFYPDPAAEARLLAEIEASGGYARALGAINFHQLYGAGENILSLPYLAAMRMYPGCLPGGSQARGDCVSWSMRSASLVSYCASLVWQDNSHRYAPPEVSDAARANGVFATETFYWFRAHSGEGWNCGDAARIALTKSGMMVRKNYPEIGIDLEEYSGATAGKWGASTPPEKVIAVTSQHLLSAATVCKTWEEVRDMLANGFALATCGSEAFERSRDEFGFCRRSNSVWQHAMSFIAADDRREVKQRRHHPRHRSHECKDVTCVQAQMHFSHLVRGALAAMRREQNRVRHLSKFQFSHRGFEVQRHLRVACNGLCLR